jgi:Tol biopolymer transport system component
MFNKALKNCKVDQYKTRNLRIYIRLFLLGLSILILSIGSGCSSPEQKQNRALPKSLRDVPASRLAYRLTTDSANAPSTENPDQNSKFATIQTDFDLNRRSDALLRTVLSPDRFRGVAIYATSETPQGEFRMDLYSTDGKLIRPILPAEVSGAFPPTVAWSPDGQWIVFIARRSQTPSSPTNPSSGTTSSDTKLSTDASPSPTTSPTSMPMAAPIPAFNTEQIYICDRDGLNTKPLTFREGLIYFYVVWSPDSRALAALACKEDEWSARELQGRSPAGRPRMIEISSTERLLDDDSTDVLPVWSPDGSKVATAFESDVAIYDASSTSPTAARIPLREQLLASSTKYDEEHLKVKDNLIENKEAKGTEPKEQNNSTPQPNAESELPVSFNPIVRLEWPQADTIFAQTGFVRIYDGKPISNYMRWHTLYLSPQLVAYQRRPIGNRL